MSGDTTPIEIRRGTYTGKSVIFFKKCANSIDFDKICYDEQLFKILKSNALLMIYNLVEATVLSGIMEIYIRLKQCQVTYAMVNKEIQSIWLKFKFNQVLNTSANHDSYKIKAKELINAILSNEILYLDEKATCISGNLDAAQIRQVCTDHGIEFVPTQESQGGFVLKDVKDRRNSLAHGVISFTKCGRDYTIDGLEKIKTETAFYLKSLLNGIEKYCNEQSFLKYCNESG